MRCDQHSKKRSGLSMHKLSCSTKMVQSAVLINGACTCMEEELPIHTRMAPKV